MKLFCLLLALMIIVLSVRPCCTDNDCTNQTGSVQQKAAKLPVKEKDCLGCSPFFSCGTCIGFTLTQPVVTASPSVTHILLHDYSVYQQVYVEEIALSIWQPPQLV